MTLKCFLAVVAVFALGGCATTKGVLGRETGALEAGRHLEGEVVGLAERAVLNARDFTYAVDVSGPPAAMAYTHLAAKQFEFGLWELDPEPRPLAGAGLNEIRFDVEALAFAPDGQRVAVGSRDGTVRVFDRKGTLVRSIVTDEPLVAIGWSRDGARLVTGSANGLLTVFEGPELRYGSDLRAHRDEVRGVAFADANRLFSGGWDKAIVPLTLAVEEREVREARVRYRREGTFNLFSGAVDGRDSLAFAFDARAPRTALTAAAARAAGIDVTQLKDTTQLQTASGTTLVRVAKDQVLVFKGLRITGVEVAICDACVPASAEGLIGQDFLARYDVAFDESVGEAVISAKAGEPVQTRQVSVFQAGERFTMPWHVNDLTIDSSGTLLGVAFSEAKAERTLEVYKREKRGDEEPAREGDCGAIVDAATGKVARRVGGHHGVVSTAAISPDGKTLATGGWDKKLFVFSGASEKPVYEAGFGWSVRRVRFSPDGRYLAVGAWTPQSARAEKDSDPAAVLYDVRYGAVR